MVILYRKYTRALTFEHFAQVLLHTVSGKTSTTSVHIDMALWLLQAALEQPLDTGAGGKGDSGLASQWGCVFSGRDIRANMQTVVTRSASGGGDAPDVSMGGSAEEGHSIVTLLKAMQLSEHFNDARPTPASLLALFGRGSTSTCTPAKAAEAAEVAQVRRELRQWCQEILSDS